jgi:hypothetical protein
MVCAKVKDGLWAGGKCIPTGTTVYFGEYGTYYAIGGVPKEGFEILDVDKSYLAVYITDRRNIENVITYLVSMGEIVICNMMDDEEEII